MSQPSPAGSPAPGSLADKMKMFQQNRATRASAPPAPTNLASSPPSLFASSSKAPHASPGKPIAPIEIAGFKSLPQVPKFGEDPQKVAYVTGDENAAPRVAGKEVKSMMQTHNIVEQNADRQPLMDSTSFDFFM